MDTRSNSLTILSCPDDATLDANLLSVYSMATDSAIKYGKRWYEDANSACRMLSERYDRPLYIVAAIVSVMSPNVRWADNLIAAEAVLRGDGVMINSKGNVSKLVGYGRNVRKGQHIALTNDVSVMKGPKVVRFFCNIMMLASDAVVDIHATQAALLSTSHNGPGSSYHRIADAYARVAATLDIYVPDFQAIIWLTWKRVKRDYRARSEDVAG